MIEYVQMFYTSTYHFKQIETIYHTNNFNKLNKRFHNNIIPLLAKKKQAPIVPEFSRIINIDQIPKLKPVLCRLLAKEEERKNLAERFDIPFLLYFAANVTLLRKDDITILVNGKFEMHLKSGDVLEKEVISSDFESVLLNNSGEGSGMSIETATDFDDEIKSDGNIDIGEIASQYLALELY